MITALTLVTLSLAKSERPPVACILPPPPCDGVTSASTGYMIPLKSESPELAPNTAKPFTRPTLSPEFTINE